MVLCVDWNSETPSRWAQNSLMVEFTSTYEHQPTKESAIHLFCLRWELFAFVSSRGGSFSTLNIADLEQVFMRDCTAQWSPKQSLVTPSPCEAHIPSSRNPLPPRATEDITAATLEVHPTSRRTNSPFSRTQVMWRS